MVGDGESDHRPFYEGRRYYFLSPVRYGRSDAASAGEKIDAGATLVQFYTGWIYRGPFFARDAALALARR